VALKTSPALCAWLGVHGLRVACDPTDLVALPMLALGLRFAAPLPQAPGLGHRAATLASALACVATSAQHPPMTPQRPSTPLAKAPPCSVATLPELAPQGPDAVAHLRVSADPAAPARCNVVLRVTVSAAPDAGLSVASTARSEMLVLAPGEALDVSITVPMAYPLRCDAAGTVRVDTHDALDPELPGETPRATASGPARCAAGLAR
jgi:hypothetical protein